jgi:hypothetical protein
LARSPGLVRVAHQREAGPDGQSGQDRDPVRVVVSQQDRPSHQDHRRRGQRLHHPQPHYGQPHHRGGQEDGGGRVAATRRGERIGGGQIEPDHPDHEQAGGRGRAPRVHRQRGDGEQDHQVEDRAFHPAVLHDRAGYQPPVLLVGLDLVRRPVQRGVDAVPAQFDQRRHRHHGEQGQCGRRGAQPEPQITQQPRGAHDRHDQHQPVADREDHSGT